ncbi:PadR family transcriptional regulator [Gloeobacter kilaueensis]|uniref:PadR family transcriptional regulator n=1 Tax=Gloeobacter kilaueensis (strain ATCC BAA-2537 / CCAP 1431/1 / ULC 316 / JS1) TaxID=1183438 RepID=U5QNA5_GLOK1|nr:PadR family transcriptional regulator [Gloeobacter kilaueensis]AGY59089.1 PadR family transcriptional regulator [Gloeobacter kilaueensis JS1]
MALSSSFPNLTALEEDYLLILQGQDLFGLQIKRALEEASNGEIVVRPGSLYNTLQRLEKKELLESWWAADPDTPDNPQLRRYYRLSERGKDYLAWRELRRQQFAAWIKAQAN